jgi:hypothetical protein
MRRQSASPARPPARFRASRAGMILQIAIKPWLSATAPVCALVVIRSRPGAQKAEEDVPRRSDHNPRMPVPHHQIRGLRLRDPLKSFHPIVEIVGIRIGVGKPRSLVNCMHEVRAVVFREARCLCIKRGSDYRQPIVRTQPPLAGPRILSRRHTFGWSAGRRFRLSLPGACRRPVVLIVNDRPSRILRLRSAKRQPADPRDRDPQPISHSPF